MTRKDYVLLAAAIRESKDFWWNGGFAGMSDQEIKIILTAIARTTDSIAKTLQAENPRFNEEQFKKACNIV
jgi:hypothetical protein